MKKYLVVLSSKKPIPEEGWDVAIVGFRLYVYAQDAKEARKRAIESIMESRRMFCRVTYIRELKGE